MNNEIPEDLRTTISQAIEAKESPEAEELLKKFLVVMVRDNTCVEPTVQKLQKLDTVKTAYAMPDQDNPSCLVEFNDTAMQDERTRQNAVENVIYKTVGLFGTASPSSFEVFKPR